MHLSESLKVLIARALSALVFLGGGAALQICLWKSTNETYWDALTSHGYMWIVYMFLALLVGEHFLRLIKKWR